MKGRYCLDCIKVKTSLAELAPFMDGCFREGLDFTLTVTGNSMQPLWQHNRDQVVLTKPDNYTFKKGDVPLYIRKSGQYVLHRIVDMQNDTLMMLGDAQTAVESGINPNQIVGVVKAFYRKGKYIDCKSRKYQCYIFVWYKLRRVRPYLLRGYRILHKIGFGNKES